MRTSCLATLLAVLLYVPLVSAQQEKTTYTYDINGRPVPSTSSSRINGSAAETTTGLNGNRVPLQSTEEKVISDGPSGRVIERIVREFDASGQPAGSRKEVVEERKNPDGSKATSVAVYDSNINGGFALRERSTTLTTQTGKTVRSETTTERPTINGSVEPVERKLAVQTAADDRTTREEINIYRRSSGGFFEFAAAEIRVTTNQDGTSVTTVDRFANTATGKMDLTTREVRRQAKQPSGTETEVVDLYAPDVSNYSAAPVLREQQIVERTPGPGQTLTERLSVRRPEPRSGKLGPPEPVSESVCKGKCDPNR